ncbi:hypothetical protein FGIG_12143 [Fasciola gigantica]|uniref:Uncharacterized protein n=1 Tax=Fasciola gigantica TaxID=46835 RepID=A0A504YF28_FASGI|nr:hypothetical protein FGIG_12143 [Fasciola gigantica]
MSANKFDSLVVYRYFPFLPTFYYQFNDGCNQVEFVTEPNLSSPIAKDVTEIPDSSTVDDTDRDSATSVRLLADVILDSEDPLVSDLLPNPSQFFSRSPSPRPDHVSNETGSTVPKDVNVLIQETEMSESYSQSPVTRAQSESLDLPNPTSSSISTGKMTTDSFPHSSVHGDAFCRPSFALVFSATPSQEAKATTEIPISRIPLARDSDPGLLCSAVDASYSHSSWTELLETQPALSSSIGPSVVCVEESRLFSYGIVHTR